MPPLEPEAQALLDRLVGEAARASALDEPRRSEAATELASHVAERAMRDAAGRAVATTPAAAIDAAWQGLGAAGVAAFFAKPRGLAAMPDSRRQFVAMALCLVSLVFVAAPFVQPGCGTQFENDQFTGVTCGQMLPWIIFNVGLTAVAFAGVWYRLRVLPVIAAGLMLIPGTFAYAFAGSVWVTAVAIPLWLVIAALTPGRKRAPALAHVPVSGRIRWIWLVLFPIAGIPIGIIAGFAGGILGWPLMFAATIGLTVGATFGIGRLVRERSPRFLMAGGALTAGSSVVTLMAAFLFVLSSLGGCGPQPVAVTFHDDGLWAAALASHPSSWTLAAPPVGLPFNSTALDSAWGKYTLDALWGPVVGQPPQDAGFFLTWNRFILLPDRNVTIAVEQGTSSAQVELWARSFADRVMAASPDARAAWAHRLASSPLLLSTVSGEFDGVPGQMREVSQYGYAAQMDGPLRLTALWAELHGPGVNATQLEVQGWSFLASAQALRFESGSRMLQVSHEGTNTFVGDWEGRPTLATAWPQVNATLVQFGRPPASDVTTNVQHCGEA